MYEVMARRYRPATFDEVVGQEHIARTLRNAIRANRVAHAYLFCGGHGCGKTSMARIFAKALVCEHGPTDTPCNQCPICRDVSRGGDTDVMEIDGASNNGVEQIRTLRDQAGYVPARARYKIYLIDEVHMLTIPAFNALLKTLEEPPPHVKFILATTDPQKIPDTILSRCQRFDFRLVPAPRLAAFFKELAAREGAAIREDALEAVAAFAGGSVRDGLSLLDQVLSFADGEVTREDVERLRGVAGAESVAALFAAFADHDVVKALSVVDETASRGVNAGDFLDQLIDFGRDLMAWVATGGKAEVSAYGPARGVMGDLAGRTGLDRALLMLDVLAQARTRIRQRALSHPQIPLEMAVARLAGLPELTPLAEWTAKLETLAAGAPFPTPASPPSAVALTGGEAQQVPTPAAPPSAVALTGGEAQQVPTPAAPPSAVALTGGETIDWMAIWRAAASALARTHPADVRRLNALTLVPEADGALRMAGEAYALEVWDDRWRLRRWADALSRVRGVPVRVRVGDREALGSLEERDADEPPALGGDPFPVASPESEARVIRSGEGASENGDHSSDSGAGASTVASRVVSRIPDDTADDSGGGGGEETEEPSGVFDENVWQRLAAEAAGNPDVLRVQALFGVKLLAVEPPEDGRSGPLLD